MDQSETELSRAARKAEEEQAARAQRLAHFDRKASEFTRRLEAVKQRCANEKVPLASDPLRLLT